MFTRQNKTKNTFSQSSAAVGSSTLVLSDNRPKSALQQKTQMSLGAMPVQRYEANTIEKVDIRNMPDNPKAKELGWNKSRIEQLVEWCHSHKQFLHIAQNINYDAWLELKEVESNQLNTQVLKTPTKGKDEPIVKALDNSKYIQSGAIPGEFIPMYRVLKQELGDAALAQVKTKIPTVKTAYGITTGTAAQVITAQKNLQDWLKSILSPGKIMSAQRSIGFEFEFANYQSGASLNAHLILGESQNLSTLFSLPFVLETDSGNELEIGMPPMLIGLVNNGPDKVGIGKLWHVLRAIMGTIRDEHVGSPVNTLPLAAKGIGASWGMKPSAATLTVGASRPSKAAKAKDKVYSQMNVSLTPEEIAKFTAGKGKAKHTSYDHEFFVEGYEKIMEILQEATGKQSKTAAINISKGLSNLLAVPSLNMFLDFPDHGTDYDVYSTVKETFGIWVKDSIPNIVDNSLTNPTDRVEMKDLLTAKKALIETEMETIIDKAMTYIEYDMPTGIRGQISTEEGAKKMVEYKNAFKTELTLTLNTLISRLSAGKPVYEKSEGAKFGKEKFPTKDKVVKDTSSRTAIKKKRKKTIKAKGEGVRKDTFVSIPKGEGAQEQMHLAEIRNEGQMEEFLK